MRCSRLLETSFIYSTGLRSFHSKSRRRESEKINLIRSSFWIKFYILLSLWYLYLQKNVLSSSIKKERSLSGSTYRSPSFPSGPPRAQVKSLGPNVVETVEIVSGRFQGHLERRKGKSVSSVPGSSSNTRFEPLRWVVKERVR